MRLVTASLIGLLTASPLLAQEPQEPVTAEREHVVRAGETLWDIAARYFSNPRQWQAIYRANQSVVSNPHWIYPNEVLVIPDVRGGPGGIASEPLGVAANGEEVAGRRPAAQQRPVAQQPEGPNRSVFYRPPPVRSQDGGATILSEPGSTIVPVELGEFLSAPYVLDPEGLDVRGVFLHSIRDDLSGPGGAVSAHPQDRVYVAYGPGPRPSVGDRLAVVNVGRELDESAGIDHIIEPRGIIRILDTASDAMEGRIEAQFGPIYPDQLLVPVAMFPDFQAERAEAIDRGYDLQGRILAFADDQPLYGPAEMGFLTLGGADGVKEGDVFHAYLPPRETDDPDAPVELRRSGDTTLPPEVVAELRVVRVAGRYATVAVDQVFLSQLAEDLPVVRVRRMP